MATTLMMRGALGLGVVMLLAGGCGHPASSIGAHGGSGNPDLGPPGGGGSDVIPPERRTTWQPGIPGGIPARTHICATIDAAKYGDGNSDATAAIQSAIDGCPKGQVVYLPAGEYKTTKELSLATGVVLRGAGPGDKGVGGTRIVANLPDNSVPAIFMWNSGWPVWPAGATDVTADVPKDATTIPVADASPFKAGDVIQIDQLDDTSYVFYGGCPYFKRPDYGPPSPDGPRSQGQTAEIVAVDGKTLTIATPIHVGFTLAHKPQVFTPTNGFAREVGVEDLYVTGGRNNQIWMIACAGCWVKGIDSDGTTATAGDGTAGPGRGMVGAHLQLDFDYRAVVRDSYFHHALHVVQGGGAYGVSLSAHTSDSLIENDIIYYLNKPLTMRATGGGNVVAYNYVDDAWTSADALLMETAIDMGHASFSAMELVEGNYASQIATDDVWGGSAWMTVFRNVAPGVQRRTALHEWQRMSAIAFEGGALYMNVVANALGTAGPVGTMTLKQAYEVHSTDNADGPAVWRIGMSPTSAAGSGTHNQDAYDPYPWQPGTTGATLLRKGNYDFVSGGVADGAASVPASLYLTSAPPWWGNNPWPYVNPTRARVVGTLPAKARFDAMNVPIQ